MKAFLLAAGLGTRLRPLTETLPKCLVPVCGRPMLSWWMDQLERHNVDDVLINLHHLPDGVRDFAREYRGSVRIHLVMEDVLLGSAGTLDANREFVDGEEQFMILYADNLNDVDLTALLRFNSEHPSPLTVGLFHAENPKACGIVSLDDEYTIVQFVEKPLEPASDLASAGMFVARPSIFEYVCPVSYPYDLGNHVMPTMIGAMNGVLVDGYLRDVGTIEGLHRAEHDWQSRIAHPLNPSTTRSPH
ncbi:MAG: nucleotidyltransferase family protein [bacterium]|nr:nucleotidyltransferase family protein [Candidatus Kapabacteria bacterium]